MDFIELDSTRGADHLQINGQATLDRCLIKQKSAVRGGAICLV